LEDGRVTGITACVGQNERCVRLDKKEFIKNLGSLRGRIAYMVLHKEFETKTYPIEITNDTGAIEFVAVHSAFRNRGIASGLINYAISKNSYKEYVLEVADTNESAVKLYTKLGFKEIHRTPQKHPKQSGINHLLYMKKI
jgi:ribosomal protein S18 acetylase RimI-like enzyme